MFNKTCFSILGIIDLGCGAFKCVIVLKQLKKLKNENIREEEKI